MQNLRLDEILFPVIVHVEQSNLKDFCNITIFTQATLTNDSERSLSWRKWHFVNSLQQYRLALKPDWDSDPFSIVELYHRSTTPGAQLYSDSSTINGFAILVAWKKAMTTAPPTQLLTSAILAQFSYSTYKVPSVQLSPRPTPRNTFQVRRHPRKGGAHASPSARVGGEPTPPVQEQISI